jgi:peroxiredoxin
MRKRHSRRKGTRVLLGVIVATLVLLGGGAFLSAKGLQTASAKINTGALAPDFSLPATTGQTITLADFRGKKNVLLFFHEGLSCDPCLQQVADLEKSQAELDRMNVVLLSIAIDPVDQQKEAAARFGIRKIPMLSYGAANTEVDYDLTPYSMGMARRAGHTFVLVGTDGTIKWRKDYWPGLGHMVPGGTKTGSTPAGRGIPSSVPRRI